jgi:hypothetical protein
MASETASETASEIEASEIEASEIDANEIVANEIVANEMGAIAKETKSWEIFYAYSKIMNDYLYHFTESEKYKKAGKDCTYLLINGFTTLTHVFKIMLNHTLTLAIENTEKAIYYYTQFIEQMDENIMYDLNVSSNNASLFVYKKTIANLQETQKIASSDDCIKNINDLLLIYRSLFDKLIQKNGYDSSILQKLNTLATELYKNNEHKNNEHKNNEHKNNNKNNSDELVFHTELVNVMLFINHLPCNKEKELYESIFYDAIYLYIKKYRKYALTLEKICKKKAEPNYDSKLMNESVTNYIKWLLDQN